MKRLHPDDVHVRKSLERALARGSSEHYADAIRYDHEYKARKDDVAFYLRVAEKVRGPILELGCGSGRLTVPLVRAGHDVVGIDASPAMLARCRERVGDEATIAKADFRALQRIPGVDEDATFALVLCPFNAFQHLYEQRDVERFLDGVRGRLAPGGRFVFDLMNPDLKWLSRDPNKRWSRTRYRDPVTGAQMIYSTQIVYDAPLQIAFMTVFYERADGNAKREPHPRRTMLTHRHFFPRELEALLAYNGFQIDRRDGDFEGGPLEATSEQQVLFCRTAARRVSRR